MSADVDTIARKPQFAIVKLGTDVDPAEFYALLSSKGHMEVSFVQDLWDSPYLQGRKDELMKEIQMNATIDAVSSGKVTEDSPNGSTRLASPKEIENIDVKAENEVKEVPIILRQESSSPEASELSVAASFPIKPRTVTKTSKTNPNAPMIKCNLCDNMIMATRLSNLTNHVRRHAFLKQYSCVYCEYNHNEMAKVRLHMLHNHKDGENSPLDNLTPEMQTQWDMLMTQCFPGFDPKTLKGVRSEGTTQTCIECGEAVKEKHLEAHIQARHHEECHPFCCKSCGYENADEWKVRLHIIVRHAEEAAGTYPQPLPPDTRWGLYKRKYFPSLPGADEEEEKLFDQLKAISKKDHRNEGPIQKDKVQCKICSKMIDFPNNALHTLLLHAKTHCTTKPHTCSVCGFASFVPAPVRSHIATVHATDPTASVVEAGTKELHVAWLTTMLQCYPYFEQRIKRFRYKGKSWVEDGDEPPAKISRADTILQIANTLLTNSVAAS
ncbi:unnamed protein product, partial [Mesorhabditis belari]|uniref:C2H2-type domain-containing protein n=1 Tax=Mesorhabditis belari TaxID=2138241 RepID=A0AAF3EWF3_9BILA